MPGDACHPQGTVDFIQKDAGVADAVAGMVVVGGIARGVEVDGHVDGRPGASVVGRPGLEEFA